MGCPLAHPPVPWRFLRIRSGEAASGYRMKLLFFKVSVVSFAWSSSTSSTSMDSLLYSSASDLLMETQPSRYTSSEAPLATPKPSGMSWELLKYERRWSSPITCLGEQGLYFTYDLRSLFSFSGIALARKLDSSGQNFETKLFSWKNEGCLRRKSLGKLYFWSK